MVYIVRVSLTELLIRRAYYIREIKRRLSVPVIVDAGVGTASDACVTMEQGVDGVPHEHGDRERRRSGGDGPEP